MQTLDSRTIDQFMAAAADVLREALLMAESDAPGAAVAVQRLAAAGGLLTVKATVGLSTGLAQLAVEMTTPAGESHTLMASELVPNEPPPAAGC